MLRFEFVFFAKLIHRFFFSESDEWFWRINFMKTRSFARDREIFGWILNLSSWFLDDFDSSLLGSVYRIGYHRSLRLEETISFCVCLAGNDTRKRRLLVGRTQVWAKNDPARGRRWSFVNIVFLVFYFCAICVLASD